LTIQGAQQQPGIIKIGLTGRVYELKLQEESD